MRNGAPQGSTGWAAITGTPDTVPLGSAADIALLRSVIDASGISARKWAESVAWREERTVRRWLSGESPIPNAVLLQLRAIAECGT